jgi:hypothetical protein
MTQIPPQLLPVSEVAGSLATPGASALGRDVEQSRSVPAPSIEDRGARLEIDATAPIIAGGTVFAGSDPNFAGLLR